MSDLNRPYRLELTAEELGTSLGIAGWVLGALQIMRDRGHADGDESYHDLLDRLTPPIERLLETAGTARAQDPDPTHLAAVDRMYGEIREGFEAWIELTAVDTAHAAIGQRLAAAAADGTIELPDDFQFAPGGGTAAPGGRRPSAPGPATEDDSAPPLA